MSGPLLPAAEPALDLAGVAGVEVLLSRSDTALTRFADRRIHQNIARTDAEARIRVVLPDGQAGVVVTNDLGAASVRAAAERARDAARLLPADPAFPGLAGPATYPSAGRDDEETAAADPGRRADLVRSVLAEVPPELQVAGTVETGRLEIAVATTAGARGYHAGTRAAASVLASGMDSTGYAEDAAPALADLPVTALAARAARKAELGRRPRDLPPGTYPVVLEPGATVVLAQWLAITAFGAKAVAEGRSPLAGRLGEQVCSPLVSIVDDALAPGIPGVPFDAEGTPKRRLPLIEGGVAVGVAHDRATAAAAGTRSTGHALPAPNPEGGIPLHLGLAPGEATLDELVGGLDRGLVVTRFHYTNLVHPLESTITGMTRDGTFWVEDGRIVGGVHNLRFTQSILRALSAVEAVGRDSEVASDLFFGAARAPALRLSAFTFTSATVH